MFHSCYFLSSVEIIIAMKIFHTSEEIVHLGFSLVWKFFDSGMEMFRSCPILRKQLNNAGEARPCDPSQPGPTWTSLMWKYFVSSVEIFRFFPFLQQE